MSVAVHHCKHQSFKNSSGGAHAWIQVMFWRKADNCKGGEQILVLR